MELEVTVYSEVSKVRNTSTTWPHSYVEPKNADLIDTESRISVKKVGGVRKSGQ